MIKVIDEFVFYGKTESNSFTNKLEELRNQALEKSKEKGYENYINEPTLKYKRNGKGWDLEFHVRILEHTLEY